MPLGEFLDPQELISKGGLFLIFAIVFAESGLLIGFFLPGDSLLFTAGMVAAGVFSDEMPNVDFNIWVLLLGVFVCAVAGDQVGYLFGRRVGPSIFNRPDSRLFKQDHIDKAQGFFDKHGPKAIVLARFVPVVRTFCPIVAGVGRMHYTTFVRYNVLGGFLWGVGVTLLGYFFGQIDWVERELRDRHPRDHRHLGPPDRDRGHPVPAPQPRRRSPDPARFRSGVPFWCSEWSPGQPFRTPDRGGGSCFDGSSAIGSTSPKHPGGGPCRACDALDPGPVPTKAPEDSNVADLGRRGRVSSLHTERIRVVLAGLLGRRGRDRAVRRLGR